MTSSCESFWGYYKIDRLKKHVYRGGLQPVRKMVNLRKMFSIRPELLVIGEECPVKGFMVIQILHPLEALLDSKHKKRVKQ